ncbi:MAG: ferredoxin [Bacteroidota bacterium]
MVLTEERVERLPQNASGKYYVTSECNGCGLCYSIAMRNIDYTYDGKLYFVFKQPETQQEGEFLCEAMELCPLNCLKDDGAHLGL